MKRFFTLFFLLGLLSNVHASTEKELNMIGLDEAGKEIEFPMKSRRLKKKMANALKAINHSTLPALNSISGTQTKFQFAGVDVGAFVKLQVGLGSVIKATVMPWFDLKFRK